MARPTETTPESRLKIAERVTGGDGIYSKEHFIETAEKYFRDSLLARYDEGANEEERRNITHMANLYADFACQALEHDFEALRYLFSVLEYSTS